MTVFLSILCYEVLTRLIECIFLSRTFYSCHLCSLYTGVPDLAEPFNRGGNGEKTVDVLSCWGPILTAEASK